MRVAIDVSAVPARPAGAGTYVLRVVERLARLGEVELVLVSRRDDASRWRALAPGSEVLAVVPSPRPVRLAWEQVAAPFVARRVDVWHGPHYTMPLLVRRPAVVTLHDLTFFDHPEWHEPSKVAYFRRMIGLAVRRAAVLVCVSDRTARDVRARFSPACPVVVAPHGVDHTLFKPATNGGSANQRLLEGLGVVGRFVVFVGTVQPRKNLPGVLRAMDALPPDVTLVVAGEEGWGKAELDMAVAASARRVVRLGYVADDVVPALYRQAAAVAYVPHDEGFGLNAIEALACGARLVTSADTPMAEMVGRAAQVVPSTDPGAIGDALATALDGGGPDPGLGPEVAAAFTWEASAREHVEAYRLACGA